MGMVRRLHRPLPARCPKTALAALAVAAVATLAAPAAAQVADPAPDRLWGGCELGRNDYNALSGSSVLGAFDVLVLYSVQTNDGQPLVAGGFTGPVVCVAPRVRIKSYSESTNIPSSDTGGSSVDIFPPVQGLLVRYDPPPNTAKRICQSTGDLRECRTVSTGSGGCAIPSSTYDGVVRTIQGERSRTIDDDGVGFAFAVAYSLASAALPRLCAAPGYRIANAPSNTAIPGTIGILDTEEALALRYRINGGARNGQTELRWCHTVASKTDCFRIYR